MRQVLHSALVQAGISEVSATSIARGWFDPDYTRAHRLKRRDFVLANSLTSNSKEFILENIVPLVGGFSSIGLLSSYVVTGLFEGSRGLSTILSLICMASYVCSMYTSKKVGKFRKPIMIELAGIALLVVSQAGLGRSIQEAIIALGLILLFYFVKVSETVRLRTKSERKVVDSIVDSLIGDPSGTAQRVVRSLSGRGLTVGQMVSGKGLPGLIGLMTKTCSTPDLTELIHTVVTALAVLGEREEWVKAISIIKGASERTTAHLFQLFSKAEMQVSIMFGVAAFGASVLGGVLLPGARVPSYGSTGLSPVVAINCCFIFSSYLYRSSARYYVLALMLTTIEVLPRVNHLAI